jgi:hypothetical protein
MSETYIVSGNEIGKQITAAIGLEHCTRVIIDCQAGKPTVIYTQNIDDKDLLHIDFSVMKVEKVNG